MMKRSTISLSAENFGRVAIDIGRVAENQAVQVRVDLSKFLLQEPKATASLAVESPGGERYPAITRMEGQALIWDVAAADVASAGMGKVQLNVLGPNGEVLKSVVAVTRISASIVGDGQAPEPVQNWIDNAAKAVNEANEAAEAAEEAAKKANEASEGAKINDAAITATNPWSSQHIVDTLCPEFSVSGNPAVCYPVAGSKLGVAVSWGPAQEGSGEPSPSNIRPIVGKSSVSVSRQEDEFSLTLPMPESIYGGNVDALEGNGNKTFKCVILTGTETWYTWGPNANKDGVTGFFCYDINDYDAIDTTKNLCSHEKNVENAYGGMAVGIGFAGTGSIKYLIFSAQNSILSNISDNESAIASFKSFLAAQNAAGTPVQIAYTLGSPATFSATGGAPISAISGTNTFSTNADSLTITGRADPTHTINALASRVAALETGVMASNSDMAAALNLLGIDGEEG